MKHLSFFKIEIYILDFLGGFSIIDFYPDSASVGCNWILSLEKNPTRLKKNAAIF